MQGDYLQALALDHFPEPLGLGIRLPLSIIEKVHVGRVQHDECDVAIPEAVPPVAVEMREAVEEQLILLIGLGEAPPCVGIFMVAHHRIDGDAGLHDPAEGIVDPLPFLFGAYIDEIPYMDDEIRPLSDYLVYQHELLVCRRGLRITDDDEGVICPMIVEQVVVLGLAGREEECEYHETDAEALHRCHLTRNPRTGF